MDELYKGYKKIIGSTEEINEYMGQVDHDDWYINEYLLLENIDDGSESEMRWDGDKFVSLRLPPSKVIKAKNALQRCTLDMLNNKDITVCGVLGGYGTGKTFNSMVMAKYLVVDKGQQSKILGIREAVGHGKSVGYLKGDFETKTDMFFLPLRQQLNGGAYELEHLRDIGVLETNIIYYLKGCTYNDTIIIVDEAEDLTEEQIRLVGTRVGENGRIFMTGDYKQGVYNKSLSNPLVMMCNELKGNPRFACVVMEEDVRSETSKMFANLFYDKKEKIK